MSFEDVATYTLFGAVAVLFVVERIRPGRTLPKIRLWTVRGLVISALSFVLSATLPLTWDAYLAPHQLLDGRWLGHAGGAVAGALLLELFSYWWHRALHGSDLLWRFAHQMHHSAERIDVPSSLYFNPLDIAGFAAVGSLALVFFLGLTPEAALAANTGLLILNIFSHTNLKTPRWLGHFIARPEYHSLHHRRGLHARNYSVFPVIDRIFGTYEDAPDFPSATGFYDGASARILAMMLGRDVGRQAVVEDRHWAGDAPRGVARRADA